MNLATRPQHEPELGVNLDKSDQLLISEAKSGSYEAFEELVDRYERKTYRLALQITGNQEDAEDVLQETFMKAFEHLERFREESSFSTWIYRIAVNQGLMKLRSRKAIHEVPLDEMSAKDSHALVWTDQRPNAEQIYAQKELRKVLLQAVRTLPSISRAAFVLRDVEGFSLRETADLLQLTEVAVRARLFRARMRLRNHLEGILKHA